MAKIFFIIACGIATFAPFLLTNEKPSKPIAASTQNFPTEFEGLKLKELALSERERYFTQDFPGEIRRFTDGRREIIIRRVTEATRKLHPAKDCFAAIGFQTKPMPLKTDENGKHWACFSAVKGDESLRVCERISDAAGNEWTDVSAWYWSAFTQANGAWLAYTVAEKE